MLPPGFDFNQISNPIGVGHFGPKVTSQGGVAPALPQSAVTPQDLLDAQQLRKFIYVWGWVRYYDVFSRREEHITRYCWQIVVIGNPFAFTPGQTPGQAGSLTFSYLLNIEGNCADDECPG